MAGVDDYDYGGLYERASRLFGGVRDWWRTRPEPAPLPPLSSIRKHTDVNLPVEDPTKPVVTAPQPGLFDQITPTRIGERVGETLRDTGRSVAKHAKSAIKATTDAETAEEIPSRLGESLGKTKDAFMESRSPATRQRLGVAAGIMNASSEATGRAVGAFMDVSDPRNTGSEHKPLSDVAWEAGKGAVEGYNKPFGQTTSPSQEIFKRAPIEGDPISKAILGLGIDAVADPLNAIPGEAALAGLVGDVGAMGQAWLPHKLFQKSRDIAGYTHKITGSSNAAKAVEDIRKTGFGVIASDDILNRLGHASTYSTATEKAAKKAGKAPLGTSNQSYTGGDVSSHLPIKFGDDTKILDIYNAPVPREDVDEILKTLHPTKDKDLIKEINDAYAGQAQYVIDHALVRAGHITPEALGQHIKAIQQDPVALKAVKRLNKALGKSHGASEYGAHLTGTVYGSKYGQHSSIATGSAPLNQPSMTTEFGGIYHPDWNASSDPSMAFDPRQVYFAPAGTQGKPNTPWEKGKIAPAGTPNPKSYGGTYAGVIPADAPGGISSPLPGQAPGAPVAPYQTPAPPSQSAQSAAQQWAAQNTPPVPAPIQYPPNTPLPVQDTAGPMYKGKPISTYEQGTIKELKAAGRTLNRQQAAKFEEMQKYEGNYKALNEVQQYLNSSGPPSVAKQNLAKLSPEAKELVKQHYPEQYYILSGETYTPPPSTAVSSPAQAPAQAEATKFQELFDNGTYGTDDLVQMFDNLSPEVQTAYKQHSPSDYHWLSNTQTWKDYHNYKANQASTQAPTTGITSAHTQAGQAFGKNVMSSLSGFTSIEIAEKFQKLPIETQAAVKIAEPELYDWLVGSYGWKNTGAPKPDLDHLINPPAAPDSSVNTSLDLLGISDPTQAPVRAKPNLYQPQTKAAMAEHVGDLKSIWEDNKIPPAWGNNLDEFFQAAVHDQLSPYELHNAAIDWAKQAGHLDAADEVAQLWDTKLKGDTLDVPPETPSAFADLPEDIEGFDDVAPPRYDALDFENQGGLDALNQDMSQVGKLPPALPEGIPGFDDDIKPFGWEAPSKAAKKLAKTAGSDAAWLQKSVKALRELQAQGHKLPQVALDKIAAFDAKKAGKLGKVASPKTMGDYAAEAQQELAVAPPSALSPLGKASLENLDAEGALDYLKNTYPHILENFGKHSGTEMGSIEEHTKDVLKQWKTQLAPEDLLAISDMYGTDVNALMNVALPLHDIGKANAIAAGDKALQHSHTIPMMTEVLKKEGFDQADIALATELFNHDMIGSLLQGSSKLTPQQVADELVKKADKLGMSPDDFAKLQLAFFQADASSYPFVTQYMQQLPNGGWKSGSPKVKPIEDLIAGTTGAAVQNAPTSTGYQVKVKDAQDVLGGTKTKTIYHKDGQDYLFKVAEPAYFADQEVSANKISNLSGLHPIKIEKQVMDGKTGTMQAAVGNNMNWPTLSKVDPKTLTAEELRDVIRNHPVDWLTGNMDAHGGQFLRTPNGIVEVDRGRAFKSYADNKLDKDYNPTGGWGFEDQFYNEVVKAYKKGELPQLTEGDIKSALDQTIFKMEQNHGPIMQEIYRGLDRSNQTSLYTVANTRMANLRADMLKFWKK